VILAKEYSQWPLSWSPDGTLLTYVEFHPSGGYDIWVLPLEGEREPRPILQTSFGERSPTFSPDGGWIAYQSDESGRNEVYVQPFPGPGTRMQISTDGGNHPVWSAGGGQLFYLNGRNMMAVDVETQPEFRAGTPRLLFERSHVSSGNRRNYDVAPDGQRFVMIQQQELSEQAQIHVILNWSDELKQLVPTGK
jgi:Tol biopolymer transport system component